MSEEASVEEIVAASTEPPPIEEDEEQLADEAHAQAFGDEVEEVDEVEEEVDEEAPKHFERKYESGEDAMRHKMLAAQRREKALQDQLLTMSQKLESMSGPLNDLHQDHKARLDAIRAQEERVQIPDPDEDPTGFVVGRLTESLLPRLERSISEKIGPIEESFRQQQQQALMEQQTAALMQRVDSETKAMSPEETASLEAFGTGWEAHYISQGHDPQSARREAFLHVQQGLKQAWEGGETVGQYFYRMMPDATPTNGDRPHEATESRPSQEVADHRQRIHGAPQESPRGRAPESQGNEFEALAANSSKMSDQQYGQAVQILAKKYDLTRDQVAMKIDDAAGSIASRVR